MITLEGVEVVQNLCDVLGLQGIDKIWPLKGDDSEGVSVPFIRLSPQHQHFLGFACHTGSWSSLHQISFIVTFFSCM